ncbi:MAG: glycoside hydrolase family 47 protein [Bacteroidales bacterium]|nr:glycoside hydrolase family 47 protein [Bacteroidales bacterium]NLM92022.1 glycoside hydrolase family 47 protein [Bacteroidales bacterium]
MMKKTLPLLLVVLIFAGCGDGRRAGQRQESLSPEMRVHADSLAADVVNETLRSWQAYKTYAWGHDVLAPLSKSYMDWYDEPLYISPIDAYSTLHVMGLMDEAAEIERYVVDSLHFDKNIDAKVFEVNIRILGGLLSMYALSGNERVLEKARDFGERMLPAFDTPTGIPSYWVNLQTGVARGDTVNVAEAATYTMEMGILSYYTRDPKYYQAAKKATLAIYSRRSPLGLIGDIINVQTGEWVSRQSHICAGVDSYYEYLYKSYLLFGDPELGKIWDESIGPVKQYIMKEHEGRLWNARVDMDSGQQTSASVTLYDAFFPATLVLSGDTALAKRLHTTWDWLWKRYGLVPMVYDYERGQPNYPVYDLNPEVIESAYYLWHFTGDTLYFNRNEHYWNSIREHCRTEVAYTAVANVETMEQRDEMATFFFAETLKYLFLTFSLHQGKFDFDDQIFNTEAHPFQRSAFDPALAREYLAF